MTSWWYAENGQQFGPIDQNSLTQHFRAGKVTPQTLVWREGMAQWQNLASVPELRILMAPPVPSMPPIPQRAPTPSAIQPQPHAIPQARPTAPANTYAANYAQAYQSPQAVTAIAEPEVHGRPASIMERYLARSLDVWIAVLIVIIPYILLFVLGLGSILAEHKYVIAFILCALSFFVDALIFGIFGNTPGKALLGVRVLRSNGSKPGFGHYLMRNIKVWIRGLGLGIPPFNFFAPLLQANRLSKSQPVSYDRASQDQVITVPVAPWRKAVFTILYILFSLYLIIFYIIPQMN